MKIGSLDVRANQRPKGNQEDYRNLRKALCVGYASQLAERMLHHNGYRTLGFKPQLVQVLLIYKFSLYKIFYYVTGTCLDDYSSTVIMAIKL